MHFTHEYTFLQRALATFRRKITGVATLKHTNLGLFPFLRLLCSFSSVLLLLALSQPSINLPAEELTPLYFVFCYMSVNHQCIYGCYTQDTVKDMHKPSPIRNLSGIIYESFGQPCLLHILWHYKKKWFLAFSFHQCSLVL